jgi:hypothetical protein
VPREYFKLNIKIKKTKVLILSKTERKAKTDRNAYLFHFNDNRLELVKEYKYLGLTVTGLVSVLSIKLDIMSSTNMLNNVGVKLSPCFAPRVVKNGSLYESPNLHEYNVLLINKYLHKLKSKLYVCFVDFKKAFDSIDRNALFQKIENKGIGGNFLKLIKDMYSNTLYSCNLSTFFVARR